MLAAKADTLGLLDLRRTVTFILAIFESMYMAGYSKKQQCTVMVVLNLTGEPEPWASLDWQLSSTLYVLKHVVSHVATC